MSRVAAENQSRYNDITDIMSSPFMAQDLIRMCCGVKIGSGTFRDVFAFDMIPNSLMKVARDAEHNRNEHQVWLAARSTKYAKWLAPCLWISPCGHFLIQKKCRPITVKDKLPKRLPNFLEDIKQNNFGYIGKQLVCHDYQFLDRMFDAASKSGMRNADWENYKPSKR